MHKFLRIEAQKTKGSLDLKYKKNSIFGLLTLIFLFVPLNLKKNFFRSSDPFLANNTA